jgi:hypothetical protein
MPGFDATSRTSIITTGQKTIVTSSGDIKAAAMKLAIFD